MTRLLEAEVLKRFVERQGGSAVLESSRVARRLGRLYYAAARQYFKARCFRQAAASVRLAHRHRRTLKGLAIGAISRCLLPLGTTDSRAFPQL